MYFTGARSTVCGDQNSFRRSAAPEVTRGNDEEWHPKLNPIGQTISGAV